MCMGMFGPPHGIPIPDEIHEQYSQELKKAWETFDKWWKKAQRKAKGSKVSRSGMTEKVKAAEKLILETPIPTMDGFTGKDSCYMVYVQSQLVD